MHSQRESIVSDSRLGILTLHYGFNEGAILQAYSLATALREAFEGSAVEIVDHRYAAKCAAYGSADGERKGALLKAIDEWLPLSPHRFISDSDDETLSYIGR